MSVNIRKDDSCLRIGAFRLKTRSFLRQTAGIPLNYGNLSPPTYSRVGLAPSGQERARYLKNVTRNLKNVTESQPGICSAVYSPGALSVVHSPC